MRWEDKILRLCGMPLLILYRAKYYYKIFKIFSCNFELHHV